MSDSTSFINDDNSLERVPSPSARTWLIHLFFFLLTLFTTTIAVNIYPFGEIQFLQDFNPESWGEVIGKIPYIPISYFEFVIDVIQKVFTNPDYLVYGLKFSLSFLFILTCHELGHYIACRIYGVDATLPFFIPTPPLIGAGTLGAFIQIRSPLPTRKATFDIGVAGPIAGFIALIPVAFLMFATLKQVTNPAEQRLIAGDIILSDPLLIKCLALLFGTDLSIPIYANPFYVAVWLGLLVTALNLIPAGQLDGGHAVYAVFGKRIHKWTGIVAFLVMATLSIAGGYFYGSPSGLLFTIILGVLLRAGHPEPLDETPLDFKRKIVAFLTLVIFILCFTPFPIQIR